MVPAVIDVADPQAAHPLAGEIGAWAEEFAKDGVCQINGVNAVVHALSC